MKTPKVKLRIGTLTVKGLPAHQAAAFGRELRASLAAQITGARDTTAGPAQDAARRIASLLPGKGPKRK